MSNAKGRDPNEYRTTMRNYMRAYRLHKRGLGPKPKDGVLKYQTGCRVCGKRLKGKQMLYCSRSCYHKQHYRRNRARILARDRERYEANKPAWIARVRDWEARNADRVRAYYRQYARAHRRPCPLCGEKMAGTHACVRCWFSFGNICRGNPACGVQFEHKHCAICSMPVKPTTRNRKIETCAHCEADRRRGAYMGWRSAMDVEEEAA